MRDEEKPTGEQTAELFTRVREYLDRNSRGLDWAARSLGGARDGFSSSTLSQILGGSYHTEVSPEKFEEKVRKIDKWLEQELAKEAAPKAPGFVRTRVAEKIFGAVRWGQKTKSMVLIVGPSGVGKSISLQGCCAETPGSVYVPISTAGRTGRAALDALAAAARMTLPHMATAQQFKHIVTPFRDTGRLIVFDECQKWAGRANDEGLHLARDFHDQTGCPVVLAGNGKLANYIRDNHGDGYDTIDQVFSRISVWLDLAEELRLDNDGGPAALHGSGGPEAFREEQDSTHARRDALPGGIGVRSFVRLPAR